MLRTLAGVAAVVDGDLHGNDSTFADVTIDTRRLNPGSLFVALRGEQVDGHAYLEAARAQGAAGALVARIDAALALSQVCVPDTRAALARMARAWRDNFELPVVAVTGSNGKTTVKELVAAILRVGRKICVTEGNLNNELGVPLTLMRLAADDRALVVELGANRPGDIAFLSGLARPTAGIITNANPAHLAGFGSLAGVATTKGELLDALPLDGVAVLNADDPFCSAWRARSRATRVVTFGFGRQADCRVVGEPEPSASGFRFVARLPDASEVELELPLLGRHNIANALAAAAATHALGVPTHDIVVGLARARAVKGRLMVVRGAQGATLIDDSYNANPASVRAALDHLAEVSGRRVFVLGDMAELGAQGPEMHREIGRYAATRCDALVGVGLLAALAVEAYGRGATSCADAVAAEPIVRALCVPEATVLIKGSRACGLDRLVAALAAVPPEGPSC
jgi:UDP-N-acetylmuramoyl-tripeptide--D-alanyl-D-alanine ligase